MLKALIGQLQCSGDIIYSGDNIANTEVEARVERGIVLVPETRELFTDMIVSDNLLLGGYVHRRKAAQVKEDMDKVYDAVSRACASGACSLPAHCRAASGRCWRSDAR